MRNKVRKLYCYVDETGQDAGSDYFIVVTIVSEAEQGHMREQLIAIEKETKVGSRKWHKSTPSYRNNYIHEVIKLKPAQTNTYFAKFKRPLPFFLPVLETLSKAIKDTANDNYQAIVYIDGIDKKKALELTNALRLKGINTDRVRSARDESEPLIRLADRWAGCIRNADKDESDMKLISKAQKEDILKKIL